MKFCYILLVVTLLVVAVCSEPPALKYPGFTELGSYNITGGPMTGPNRKTFWISTHFQAYWDQAKTICSSYGMEFLSLESLQEADGLLSLCHKKNALFDQWTHIGGVTTVPKSKTEWYWVETGKKVNFTLKFGSGQPDNAGGKEWCLSLGKQPSNSFFFNDINCYGMHQFKFICQVREFVQ